MSYQLAMEAAGAVVHDYEQFGDYQGTWLAKVTYNGVTGYVHGSYGSCSGCDAFEAEFGFESHDHEDSPYYNPIYDGPKEGCAACAEFMDRLKKFGETYLEGNLMTYEEAVQQYSGKYYNDESIVAWLANHN